MLTRESLRIEAVRGGFGAVYPVLRAMEEAGRIRRGHLVAGAGATQFAVPGALDRLRDARRPDARSGEAGAALLLAATDPAQPYGAALAWPATRGPAGRPARAAGAMVVLVAGLPAAYLERSGRSLLTFEHAASAETWLAPLVALVNSGRRRRLEIARIDGREVHDSPLAGPLEAAGFQPGYRGLILRS